MVQGVLATQEQGICKYGNPFVIRNAKSVQYILGSDTNLTVKTLQMNHFLYDLLPVQYKELSHQLRKFFISPFLGLEFLQPYAWDWGVLFLYHGDLS